MIAALCAKRFFLTSCLRERGSLMDSCTAPGHPDCTINCSNGCIALYIEPSGPCYISCSDNITNTTMELPRYSNFSVAINEMPASRLESIIGVVLPNDLRDAMIHSSQKMSLTLSSINFDKFVEALRKIVPIRARA
jgi:hypothetical protein